MSYSQGKTSSSGTTTTSPTISGTQGQYLGNQAQLGTQSAQALGGTLGSATDLYNQTAGSVGQQGQNIATYGNQLGQGVGQTGMGGYQSGLNALTNISSPAYQQAEINAAMIPAQQQYAQNLAAQGAQFGGAGQLGSARQALAGQQLAGQNQLNQQQAAAGVLNNLTNQQIQAGQGAGQLGLQGAQQGMAGLQAGLGGTQANMNYLQQLASLYGGIAGTGQANPNFSGTIGQTTSTGQQGANNTAGIQI
jgi:hypothetical protein